MTPRDLPPPPSGVPEQAIETMIMAAWSPAMGMPPDYWILARPLERALADRFFRLGFEAGYSWRIKDEDQERAAQ